MYSLLNRLYGMVYTEPCTDKKTNLLFISHWRYRNRRRVRSARIKFLVNSIRTYRYVLFTAHVVHVVNIICMYHNIGYNKKLYFVRKLWIERDTLQTTDVRSTREFRKSFTKRNGTKGMRKGQTTVPSISQSNTPRWLKLHCSKIWLVSKLFSVRGDGEAATVFRYDSIKIDIPDHKTNIPRARV